MSLEISDTINPTAAWRSRLGKRLHWLAGAAITLAVLASVLSLRNRSQAKSMPEPSKGFPVAVEPVLRTNLSCDLKVLAEFRPYLEVDVHAKVAGYLQTITVDIGDRVEAGQLLATLEIPELNDDLAHAEATLRREKAEVDRAKSTYQEAHDIYTRLNQAAQERPHLIAQQDIDTAQARDQNAFSAWEAAKDQVQEAQTAINKLKTMLSYTRITAPFSGVITKRYADPGALIQAGTASSVQAMPLVRLSKNDRLRLDFPVSVAYVNTIHLGDQVRIQMGSSGQQTTGVISRFTRKVETATRKMETEIEVPNADLKIIPGVYANVLLQVEQHNNVLAVPVEAVSGVKHPTVYVVNQNHEIEERPITLGVETPTKFEVVSGLKENELVMIGDRTQFKSGQKVEPTLNF